MTLRTAEPTIMSEKTRDRRNAFYCALAVALAVIVCAPYLELGINDDWSYTLTARDLARTGHFVYNGWSAAMIGAQAVWAALFIKIFGFSYTLVRFTTLPLAMSCAALIYALHRRAGIDPSRALFGTLAICMSPVYLPLAATFMTDVPGLFFLLLCVYGIVRAAEDVRQSAGKQPSVKWLLLVAVAGLLGGTVRQIVWVLLPVCFLFYTRLLLRQRGEGRKEITGGLVVALGLLAVTLAAAGGCLVWYQAQPRALSEPFTQGLDEIIYGLPGSLSRPASWTVLSCTSLLFAVFLYVLPSVLVAIRKRYSPISLLIIGSVEIGIAVVGKPLFFRGLWLGNLYTPNGPLGAETTTTGFKPLIFPAAFFETFYFVACLVLMTVFLGLILSSKRKLRIPSDVHAVLWAMAVVYTPLLFPRFYVGGAFDRYMIPLLVVLSVTLLRWYQDIANTENRPHVSGLIAGWTFLAFYAFIGVAATHDYIACLRAEQATASYLTQNLGVKRTAISAGLEYDCTTQIMEWGYLNDPRIHPAALYHKPLPLKTLPVFSRWWYRLTPAISPKFFIVLSPQEQLETTSVPTAVYDTWLPPGRRQLLVQQLP